jgi:hypothetical protein
MNLATEGEASEVYDFGRLVSLNNDSPAPHSADTARWSTRAMLAFAFGTSAVLWAATYLSFAILTATH